MLLFQESFNRDEALKKGIIIPTAGVNEAYDATSSDIEEIEHQFNDLLRKYKSQLQCNITFVGSAKTRCFLP